MTSHSLLDQFIEGDLTHDFRQKIFQIAFKKQEAVIDLLTLAIPEIEELQPIIQDIRTEEAYFSWIKPQAGQRKLMAEDRLDFLIKLHLEKLGCDIYLFVLHQSHEKKFIELEMANYILQQYRKDMEEKRPLLRSLAIILNVNVHSSWQPKNEFQEILSPTEHPLLKQSSLNFKLWNVNVNDPGLKELSRDKPLMVLLILERLRTPGLDKAEAFGIIDDAWAILETLNKSQEYAGVIRQEALLICSTYPEDPQTQKAIIDYLLKNKHVEQDEAKTMGMYIEQVAEKNFQEGQQKGLQKGRQEGAQQLLLEEVQEKLGNDQGLAEQIEKIHDFEAIKRLTRLLIKEDIEGFRKALQDLTLH